MAEHCFNALGTRWTVESIEKTITKDFVRQLESEVTRFEKSYSRFTSESYLGRLNLEHRLVDPPEELVAMFLYALEMFKKTEGLFNISVGAELEKKGYGLMHNADTRLSSNLVDEIFVSNELITLAPHLRVDFGGFGKGWLIDRIHDMLTMSNYESFCINGGGDLRIGNKPLNVVIEHPTHNDEYIHSLTLIPHRALAVSSRQKRQWIDKNGDSQDHIINTGITTDSSVLQVAICASSALLADTFATVFFNANETKRQQFAHEYALEYMTVYQDNGGELSILKSKLF